MPKKDPSQQVAERVGGVWLPAFNAIRAELTPQFLLDLLAAIRGNAIPTDPGEALILLQNSMALAQLISANDRAAAMVAAQLVQYVKTSAVDYGDEA